MSRFKKLISFALIAVLTLGIGMLALPAQAQESFFDQVLNFLQQIADYLAWIVDLLMNPTEPGTISVSGEDCENCAPTSISDNRTGGNGISRTYFLTVTGTCPVKAYTGPDADTLKEVMTPTNQSVPYRQGYRNNLTLTTPKAEQLWLKCVKENQSNKCEFTVFQK